MWSKNPTPVSIATRLLLVEIDSQFNIGLPVFYAWISACLMATPFIFPVCELQWPWHVPAGLLHRPDLVISLSAALQQHGCTRVVLDALDKVINPSADEKRLVLVVGKRDWLPA